MSEPSDTDDLEVIYSSDRYALTLGPGGHQIWDLDAPASAEPIATYPGGDAGFDSAWDRYLELGRADRRRQGRTIRILWIAALVSEFIWLVVGLISTVIYYRAVTSTENLGGSVYGPSMTNVLRFQTLDQAMYHIALALLSILLTIWVGRGLAAPEPVRPPRIPTSLGRSDPDGS